MASAAAFLQKTLQKLLAEKDVKKSSNAKLKTACQAALGRSTTCAPPWTSSAAARRRRARRARREEAILAAERAAREARVGNAHVIVGANTAGATSTSFAAADSSCSTTCAPRWDSSEADGELVNVAWCSEEDAYA